MQNKHVMFFSQTGSEILGIYDSPKITRSKQCPDMIVTNQRPDSVRKVNKDLEDFIVKNQITYKVLPNRPTLNDYRKALEFCSPENTLITLHGWLRIVPPELTEQWSIFNGHPGDIVNYPNLKGKDPQLKAYQKRLSTSGCVIHEVVPGVDEGKIHAFQLAYIYDLTLPQIYIKLAQLSQNMWVDFLKSRV